MALDLSKNSDFVFDEVFTNEASSADQWKLTYKIGVTAEGAIAIRELTITPHMTTERWFAGKWANFVLRRVPGLGITNGLLRQFRLEAERLHAEAYARNRSDGRRLPSGLR